MKKLILITILLFFLEKTSTSIKITFVGEKEFISQLEEKIKKQIQLLGDGTSEIHMTTDNVYNPEKKHILTTLDANLH